MGHGNLTLTVAAATYLKLSGLLVKDVVIFDGVCNFCAHTVNFILRHEAEPSLLFTPLQSVAGGRLLREFNFNPEDAKTFVLVSNGSAYVKSEAAIRVARSFTGAWKLLSLVRFVPRPIRDRAYDFIARHRYRWFGRLESCMVPTPELAARFIHD